MKKKRLPINPHPPIVGYTVYPLAIVAAHDAYLPWFYSQHIQVFCPPDFPENLSAKFDFYRHPLSRQNPCPLLNTFWLHRSHCTDAYGAITPFLIQQLDEDRYIQLYANEFHIPDRGKYLKTHYTHALLIFGYDLERGDFDILGYNRQGNFAPSKIAFEHLEIAFQRIHYLPERMETVGLFAYNPDALFEFDLHLAIDALEDYVFSRNTSERFRMMAPPIDGLFGIETYRELITRCERCHPSRFDIRPLHILWEHKKCMLGRIRYMETRGHIDPSDGFSNGYEQIEDMAQIVRMMALKLRASHNTTLLVRLMARLEHLAQCEVNLLGCLLESLRVAPFTRLAQTVSAPP